MRVVSDAREAEMKGATGRRGSWATGCIESKEGTDKEGNGRNGCNEKKVIAAMREKTDRRWHPAETGLHS